MTDPCGIFRFNVDDGPCCPDPCEEHADCYVQEDLAITLGDDWANDDCDNCDFSGDYVLTFLGLGATGFRWVFFPVGDICECDESGIQFRIAAIAFCFEQTCHLEATIGLFRTAAANQLWRYVRNDIGLGGGGPWVLDFSDHDNDCTPETPCVPGTRPAQITLEVA